LLTQLRSEYDEATLSHHPVLADLILETQSIAPALLARLEPQEPEREAR